MIWLATPFALVDSQDPLFEAALAEITAQLSFEGGIRRYPSDTFFGGGAWPVLTASLGWQHAVTGDREAAQRSLAWMARHIDDAGTARRAVRRRAAAARDARAVGRPLGAPSPRAALVTRHVRGAERRARSPSTDATASKDDPTSLRR